MVTMDAFASAFGFDAKSDDVWTTLGKVTAVGSGTLSVLLGGSATPTECEAYCLASVGDIVFVAITKGRARAIACKGGGAYLPLAGGTITGDLTVNGDVSFDGEATISEQSAWRDALGVSAKPIQLYNNTSGSTGTITLSQSAANFNHMRIYFMTNSGGSYSSIDVYSPNGKNVGLFGANATSSSVTRYASVTATISGTSITPSNPMYFNRDYNSGNITGSLTNVIYIVRVEGWND